MNADAPKMPRTIAEYLEQLRAALRGADPALIQDALYDAEEHLRAELADQPGRSEADMLAKVVSSYGAPEEVADIYRDQEIKIQRALRPPKPPKQASWLGQFFGVAADPHTYGALFYMVLSLATGIFYFTWAVTGISLSFGLFVLIIGIPFALLFLGSVRMLSLMEGRIVETMLGVRMPRRPPFSTRGMSFWQRIGAVLSDPRTWGTLAYMVLMLPLGIAYFTIAVTMLSTSLALALSPIAKVVLESFGIPYASCNGSAWICEWVTWWGGWPGTICASIIGIVMLFATLHIVRGLGYLHGQIAKHLLVAGSAKE
ncbi:sensor domain-containing protein [Dyella nitratireducens]|uniref:Membrane protein n=1 Tax=Dyella nitratireducens TaxID=1849580 RepID=A0ABQ1FJZ4_9GAMM|nr:sensor domain-containing protein [Dyella nitratireducens]GGA19282.1 membrane protein [Dyella nitratireducens]GLQ44532.1 membrane protein [Dyella nitratireducens]